MPATLTRRHMEPLEQAGSRYAELMRLGGPVRFVVSGSGHIAGVVNPPARSRYQHWTNGPPTGELATWHEGAEEHPGSWWPDWQAWSEAQDGRRGPARGIGGGEPSAVWGGAGRPGWGESRK